MGFLGKAKVQAQKLQETVVDKTSTIQRDRKVDKLLEELGTLAFLELAGRAEPAHAARIEALRADLIQAEADGVSIQWRRSGPSDHRPPPPPPPPVVAPLGDPPTFLPPPLLPPSDPPPFPTPPA